MNIKNEKGFTLLELLAVMTVIGILIVQFIPNVVEDVRQNDANVTAGEILSIGEAAQNWVADNGSWPDQGNTCASAITTMVAAAGYIDNLDDKSPWYDATTNPAGAYTTSCTATSFTVTVSTHADWSGVLANTLPVTTALGAQSQTTYPLPSTIPALDDLLPRDGSRAMTGDLDLDSNNINNINTATTVSTVATTDMRSPEFIDSDDVIYKVDPNANTKLAALEVDDVCLASGKCLSDLDKPDSIVGSGTLIPKPTCNSGVPQVFADPVLFSKDATGDAIGAVQAYAVDAGANWQVFLRILTKDGFFFPSATYGKLHVKVRCS